MHASMMDNAGGRMRGGMMGGRMGHGMMHGPR
jgi:hypothetical protein